MKKLEPTIEDLKKEIQEFAEIAKESLDATYPNWIFMQRLDDKIFTREYWNVIMFESIGYDEIQKNPNSYSQEEVNWFKSTMKAIRSEYEPALSKN